ncbi:MAG TPA: CPBP family intramembrane glutamic endopeptidase [Thermoanaerobaculia bacterium]|jgi:membrane protease YdiL (CAAX protease family)|nr:CPBP family intramembrane glutamic endopeptidase [Thermoanaerobaculia bacterium]
MRHRQPITDNRQRLSESDWILIAICIALVLSSVALIVRYFQAAFPQAAIEFKVDRNTSEPIAARLLKAQRIDVREMKHAARFDSDDEARIFLERSLGLEEANGVMAENVHVWSWHHRWFRPLVEEEYSVDVAPTGEIVGFRHRIPEDRAAPPPSAKPPVEFLRSIGVDIGDLNLIEQSERRLPKRVQRIFTWESSSIRPAGAQYRHVVTVDGDRVTSYAQSLKVPDAWKREYSEMRSKNRAAGQVDLLFNGALMVGAIVIFISRLRRGDLPLRFLLGIGAACVLLVGASAINEMPAQLAYYDTTSSYAKFLGDVAFQSALQSVGMAMMLIVICGAGEVLYRERLPKQLAMPRLLTPKALSSRRVFLSMILGYTLVPMFMAYQVVFYLTAHRFGAWAPAEVPYDDILNSALPWVAVVFAGFFPAFSEEFLSRAFAIPFLQRFVRSRFVAIVFAAFIWGFGHAAYPNQPFWIRGVEVGLAGIVAGLLMERFGLLPLLVWHYTIDAVYTATLLFASGNTYYIVSAAIASLLFAIPLIVSIALYLRNRGFVPDDDLTNATMPTSPPDPHPEVAIVAAQFPAPKRVSRKRIAICVVLMIAAGVAFYVRPTTTDDVIDYRITGEQAKAIARTGVARSERFAYVIAAPVEGFRSWNPGSGREEGGSPGDFDDIAATWLMRKGMSVDKMLDLFRNRIEAGTWIVRFFTPLSKEEIFVEVDPRTSRVISYHKYQDERNDAPSLPQNIAQALARRAFVTFWLDEKDFELKETLSFQQPRRRDWLFHFDEKTPLAPNANRRVTVRIAGNAVTQFNKTIHVPDSVYREATTQTFLNLILLVLKIAGMVALLALVIAGLIMATRSHGLPWRRALRWTLMLSVIPIAAFVVQAESLLFNYSTTVAWETFAVSLVTSFVRTVGLQVGLMFLALAGLEAAVPYALSLATREGRARFGRSAAVAALMTISIATIVQTLEQFLALAMPSMASVSLSAPSEIATPFPAVIETLQGVFLAIIVAAAVALYSTAIRKHTALVTILGVFCASIDPMVTLDQTPLMLARAIASALLVWVVAKYVLDGNPLAWPLAVFVSLLVQTAAALLQNHRPDLIGNSIALIVFAVAAVVWAATPRPYNGEPTL